MNLVDVFLLLIIMLSIFSGYRMGLITGAVNLAVTQNFRN